MQSFIYTHYMFQDSQQKKETAIPFKIVYIMFFPEVIFCLYCMQFYLHNLTKCFVKP